MENRTRSRPRHLDLLQAFDVPIRLLTIRRSGPLSRLFLPSQNSSFGSLHHCSFNTLAIPYQIATHHHHQTNPTNDQALLLYATDKTKTVRGLPRPAPDPIRYHSTLHHAKGRCPFGAHIACGFQALFWTHLCFGGLCAFMSMMLRDLWN